MGRGREGVVVAHGAVGGRILDDGAELAACEFVLVVVVDDEFDAERFAAREQHVERLREDVAVDEELVAPLFDRFARAQREHHGHGFGRGGAFVQKRAVADLHACERDDGGLEVEQGFQTALRDFSLIGGVGGVPRRILEDVAHHGGRHGAGVVAHADEPSGRASGFLSRIEAGITWPISSSTDFTPITASISCSSVSLVTPTWRDSNLSNIILVRVKIYGVWPGQGPCRRRIRMRLWGSCLFNI